jgi:hypothetical protein
MSQSHQSNPYREGINQEIAFIEALAAPGQPPLNPNEENEILDRILQLIDKIKLVDNYADQVRFLNRLDRFVTNGRQMSMRCGPAANAALVRAILEVPIDLTFSFRAALNQQLHLALLCDRSLELYAGEAEDRLQTARDFEPRTVQSPPNKTGISWKAVAADFLVSYIGRRRKPRP